MTRRRKNGSDSDYDPYSNGDEDTQRDIQTDSVEVLRPYHFRSEGFARLNIDAVTDYARYRASGLDPERSFVRTFGTAYADIWLSQRVEAMEHNPVFREVFAREFAAMDPKSLWSVKQSIHELVSLMNHPFTRCSTKLAALRELNVLFNITMIDEAGRTVKGKALSDFYSEQAPASPVHGALASPHPAPGTPESEAFLAARAKELPKPD